VTDCVGSVTDGIVLRALVPELSQMSLLLAVALSLVSRIAVDQ